MRKILSLLMLTVGFVATNAQVEGTDWSFDAATATLTIKTDAATADIADETMQPWGEVSSQVENVVVAEGVTVIGEYAFAFIEQLTSVSIASTVNEIMYYSFAECPSLTTIHYMGATAPVIDEALYGSENVCVVSDVAAYTTAWGAKSYLINGLTANKLAYSYETYDKLLQIEVTDETELAVVDKASMSVSLLSKAAEIVLGNGITEIEASAFDGYKYVTSLTLPATLTTIGESAFKSLIRLSKVTSYATTAPTLGATAFYEKSSASKPYLSVPETEETVESYVQAGYETYFVLPNLSPNCGAEGDNLTFSYANGVLTITGEGDMADWDNVKEVPWYNHASEITKVVLPEGLTKIGARAFYACMELSDVAIPTTVNTIGAYAFYRCALENGVTIYEALSELGANAFGNTAVGRGEADCVMNSVAVYDNIPTAARKILNIVDGGTANSSITEEYVGKSFASAVYRRTFAAGGSGTVVVPFTISRADVGSLHFYEIVSSSSDGILFGEVNTLQPNIPYIWKNDGAAVAELVSTDEEFEISIDGLTGSSSGSWQMCGVFTKEFLTGSDIYAYSSSKQMLINYTGGLNVSPFRAYIKGVEYGSNAAANIKERNFTISFNNLDGTTTAIEDVIINEGEGLDFGDGAVYDLSGRRVENPSCGIYIVDGKKKYIK